MYPHTSPTRAVIGTAAATLVLLAVVMVVTLQACSIRTLRADNAAIRDDLRECRHYLEADAALLDAYAESLSSAQSDATESGDLLASEKADHAKHHRSAPRAASRPATRKVASAPATSGRGCLTRSQVVHLLSDGCAAYGISGEERAWVIAAGVKVAWGESRYNPNARNGQHVGLMQFRDSWGSVTQRLDPAWSARRFAKVYAQGGKEAVRRHWAATIGGM